MTGPLIALFVLLFLCLILFVANKLKSDTEISSTPKDVLVGIYYCPTNSSTLVYVYKKDIEDYPPFYSVYHYNLQLETVFKQGSGYSIAEALKGSDMILGGKLEYLSSLGHLGLRTEGEIHDGKYNIKSIHLSAKDESNITLDAVMKLLRKNEYNLSKGVLTLIRLYKEQQKQAK